MRDAVLMPSPKAIRDWEYPRFAAHQSRTILQFERKSLQAIRPVRWMPTETSKRPFQIIDGKTGPYEAANGRRECLSIP
jgi:hypothetical protein